MSSPRRPQKTTDGIAILRRQFVEGNPEVERSIQEAHADFDVAQAIYDLRHEAGLTQKELAERIGTTPSVISRLEDADYEGHSLAMLRRIAAALDRRVVIGFIPTEPALPGAGHHEPPAELVKR